ncbi:MAG: hypothetical protein CO078_00780 [Candidatus Nealsonbacteria bacterium CG_4_9_14_0_8_um_filter_36_17]|uniref:Peptidase A2 domain-containing protein n=1 Tax=Candidatus Nealsonbacteria bacterium CG_4_9_14_0_8_um_filter_36_17 TaxID=1974693 RepID=A0A2M8DLR1_9BACT|nr:MAG: hypothetical protein CO078_00780 [Candidatus Nealsonbacteria bacterium CG_4_9_14_0_8_um_filter_36_17]
MISFKYQKEKSDLGEVWRPIAQVTLLVKNFRVEVPLYIDSGADITLIPLGFGEALGFKQDSAQIKEIRGVSGGTVPYIIKNVKLLIGDVKFSVRIAWSLSEEVPPLLGRLDVFTKFKIVFDEENKIVEFHPKSIKK